MRLLYKGPRKQIEIAGYGLHAAGEIKTYPEPVATELLRTSVRQIFQPAEMDSETAPDHKKPGKRRSV